MSSGPSLKINKIGNEGDVGVKEIMKEALNIFTKVRKTDKSTDKAELYESLSRAHSKFFVAYPIVLWHMCFEERFNIKVFARMLKYILANPWKTDADKFESFGHYAAGIMQVYNPKMNKVELMKYRANYVEGLLENAKKFQKTVKGAEVDFEKRDSARKVDLRAELVEKLRDPEFAKEMLRQFREKEATEVPEIPDDHPLKIAYGLHPAQPSHLN
jgi:hypothetical protein